MADGRNDAREFYSDGKFAEWLNHNPQAGQVAPMGWFDIATFPHDGYGVAILTARPCQVDQVRDALARYFFEGPFAGEYYGTQSPDALTAGGGSSFLIPTSPSHGMMTGPTTSATSASTCRQAREYAPRTAQAPVRRARGRWKGCTAICG